MMPDFTPLTNAEFNALKHGDVVRCINNTNVVNSDWYPIAQTLQKDTNYVVQSRSSNSLYVKGINFGYSYQRFALYSLTPKGNQRREI